MSISPDNAMGALAGAIVAVLCWLLPQVWVGHTVPADIQAALIIIVYFIVCHFWPIKPGPAVSLEIKP